MRHHRCIKSFALCILLLAGCHSAADLSENPTESPETPKEAHPPQVTKALSLIKKLKPETDAVAWTELFREKVGLPADQLVADLTIDGGASPDGRWLINGIGAGDEWVIHIMSQATIERPDFQELRGVRLIRTSITKELAKEPLVRESLMPYYMRGKLYWEESHWGGRFGPGKKLVKPEDR